MMTMVLPTIRKLICTANVLETIRNSMESITYPKIQHDPSLQSDLPYLANAENLAKSIIYVG